MLENIFRIYYRLACKNRMQDYFANESNMAIPTMFLIDRQGKITEKKVGFVPGSVEKSIKKLLK